MRTVRYHRRWLPLALLAVAACAPTVTHSPVVTPGASLTVTAGYSGASFSCYDRWMWEMGERTDRTSRHCPESDYGLVPLLISAAWSWKQTPASSGYRLGIDVPAFPFAEALLFAQLSGYWQAPKRSGEGFDRGVGAVVSPIWVAPYAQIGRIDEKRRGWFTTQMVAVPHPLLRADEDFGPGWHSTFAYQVPHRPRRLRPGADAVLRLFVGGGIERTPIDPFEEAVSTHYYTRSVSGGIMMEVFSASGRLPTLR